MTDKQDNSALTPEQALARWPAYEVFKKIKAGELILINRDTGRPVPCPWPHHEYTFTPLPERFKPAIDLTQAELILSRGGSLREHGYPSLKESLPEFFGCSLDEITLDMVKAAQDRLDAEYKAHQKAERDRMSDDPDHEKWEHLILPRTSEEAERLKAYLGGAVLWQYPEARAKSGVQNGKPTKKKGKAYWRWQKIISMSVKIKEKHKTFTCENITDYIRSTPELKKAVLGFGFKRLPTHDTMLRHLQVAAISKPGPQKTED